MGDFKWRPDRDTDRDINDSLAIVTIRQAEESPDYYSVGILFKAENGAISMQDVGQVLHETSINIMQHVQELRAKGMEN